MMDPGETTPKMALAVHDTAHLVEELRAYHAMYSPLFQRREQTDGEGIHSVEFVLVHCTRLAYERTLMAWVPTATSLISFGFTIYKFFQFLHAQSKAPEPAHLLAYREFALLMILVGLVMLVLATLQHWHQIRLLRAHGAAIPFSLAMVLACLIGGLGVVGTCVALFRH